MASSSPPRGRLLAMAGRRVRWDGTIWYQAV